jgi:hypothetical protein
MDIETKFESLCQCCLTETGVLKNMGTENFKRSNEHNLLAIYKKCSGVEITTAENYKFGHRICERCVDRLTVTYEFREQCKSSYKVLKERYDLLMELKEEPMSDDEPLILNNDEPGKRTQVFVRHKIKSEKFIILPTDTKEETTELIQEPVNNDDSNNEDTDMMVDDEPDAKDVTPKEIVEEPAEESLDEVETMEAHFMCYYCDAILTTHSDYIIHRENHVMEHTTIAKARSISRNCFLCGEFQISYVKHLENDHKDFHPNKCKKCKKSFRSPKLLKKHLYKHLNSETFECLGCNKKFSKFSYNFFLKNYILHFFKGSHCQRRSHLSLEKHSRDVYRCSVCGLGCEKYLDLHQHFKKQHKHQNTKQLFPCYDCRTVFSYIKYFLQHKCPDMGKRKRSLDSLAPGDPTFTCDRCSQKFADEDEMVCHKFTVCSARSKCSFPDCGKVLENRHALLNHMRRHKQKGSFICDECGFSACSAPKLAIHKEKHKPVTRINYIKCPHPGCTAELKSDYTLQSHLRRHGEGQFECYLCQKKFRHRVTIQGHMIKCHIPEEQLQHVCGECGKRFFTARDLKIHARLHNGELSF